MQTDEQIIASLPPPPPHSAFTVKPLPDGVEISWKSIDKITPAWVQGVFTLFKAYAICFMVKLIILALISLVCIGVLLCMIVFSIIAPPIIPALLIVLIVMALFVIAVIQALFSQSKSYLHTLQLRREMLQHRRAYQQGTNKRLLIEYFIFDSYAERYSEECSSYDEMKPPPQFTVYKDAIDHISQSQFNRLLLQVGTERHSLGDNLTAEECAWLVGVVQDWRAS